jgi:hypothetical protein
MKNIAIICLSVLCLASCDKKKEFDPAFIVITKEPIGNHSSFAYARGAIVSMDQIQLREVGFFWYSLTPPTGTTGPRPIIKVPLGYVQVYGDFNQGINFSTQSDSFNIHAYVITSQGDSIAGKAVKFYNQ